MHIRIELEKIIKTQIIVMKNYENKISFVVQSIHRISIVSFITTTFGATLTSLYAVVCDFQIYVRTMEIHHDG